MLTLENSIIDNVINNEEYFVRTYGYLKQEYFKDQTSKLLFKKIKHIVDNNNIRPSYQDVLNVIENDKKVDNNNYSELLTLINDIKTQSDKKVNTELLFKQTEKWARERAFKTALIDSMKLVEADKELDESISLVEKALAINFTIDTGIFIWDDESAVNRYMKYLAVNTMKCGFKPWDDLTGGIEPETLTCIQAPINGGKTLSLCALAVEYNKSGYDVGYITLEMKDSKISQRIDANLVEMDMYDLKHGRPDPEKFFENYFKSKSKNPNAGRFAIKQYETGNANANTIKLLLGQWKTFNNFEPKVLFIDYLGIMGTVQTGIPKSNVHVYQKVVAEEVRALAQTQKIAIISALQVTKDAMKEVKKNKINAKLGMEDTGGSVGIPQTLDGLISSFELKEDISQYITDDVNTVYIWENSKTRNDNNNGQRIIVGVNTQRMKLVEINQGQNVNTQINHSALQSLNNEIDDYMSEFADI